MGVDSRHTRQGCPACGHQEKKPLWVREFTCPACGASLHQDVAAAIHVLARSGLARPQMGSDGAFGDGYGVGRPVRTEVTRSREAYLGAPLCKLRATPVTRAGSRLRNGFSP
ncbi:transposase [Thermus scotoductus]|uniref:transposase n=1 Tax=Thermus scotoductus TaxID=37636 RepID=UPI0020A26393|nr:transposase [Thermus scotoductus]